MPMSNADNPVAEKVTETAPKKAKAATKPAEASTPELAKASTSGSADVQNLLAKREIAVSNGDETHIAVIDGMLAELGFRA